MHLSDPWEISRDGGSLGGVPSAHVVHAETDQAEVVPIFGVTPRDE
jgi:hypothetical protein